jgi:hypothetical protein
MNLLPVYGWLAGAFSRTGDLQQSSWSPPEDGRFCCAVGRKGSVAAEVASLAHLFPGRGFNHQNKDKLQGSNYVSCLLAPQNGCMAAIQAQDQQRRQNTFGTLKLE